MVFKAITQTPAEDKTSTTAPKETPTKSPAEKKTSTKAPEKTPAKAPEEEKTSTLTRLLLKCDLTKAPTKIPAKAPTEPLNSEPIVAVFWPRDLAERHLGPTCSSAASIRLDGRSGFIMQPSLGCPIGTDLITCCGQVHSHADRLSLDHMVWENQSIPSLLFPPLGTNHVSFIFRSKSNSSFKKC